jgi:hypothetical protein
MRVNELVSFIKERENVRKRKEAGAKQPWTSDSILQRFRFCNVHREDDRVTRWLRAEYYPTFEGEKDVWFAAVVARLFNLPESLASIQRHIVPFRPVRMRAILHSRRARGEKNFNAAYIVSTNGVAMDKVDYLLDRVLGVLWAERHKLRVREDDTLESFYNRLIKFDGMGSFIAAQVVADLKYIPLSEGGLRDRRDWWTFAASGPGSRRGLNRVMGADPVASWKEIEWRSQLARLREAVSHKYGKPMHAQDLQNCLCEFDKYERARLGEGTPKQLYKEIEYVC